MDPNLNDNVQQNTTLFDPFFPRGFERTDKGGSLNSSLHDPKPIGDFVSSRETNLSEAPMMSQHMSKRIFIFRLFVWCLDDCRAVYSAPKKLAPVFGIGAVWSSMTNGTF